MQSPHPTAVGELGRSGQEQAAGGLDPSPAYVPHQHGNHRFPRTCLSSPSPLPTCAHTQGQGRGGSGLEEQGTKAGTVSARTQSQAMHDMPFCNTHRDVTPHPQPQGMVILFPLLVALLSHASSWKPPWIPSSSPLPLLGRGKATLHMLWKLTTFFMPSSELYKHDTHVQTQMHACACTHTQECTPPLAPLPASDAIILLSWQRGCEDTTLWGGDPVTLVLRQRPCLGS